MRNKVTHSVQKLAGFTLIELLVVIAVLGILAAVVLVAVDPGARINEARDAGRKQDLSSLSQAIETYFTLTQGSIPRGSNGPYTVSGGQWYSDYSFQPTFLDELTAREVLKTIPADPSEQPTDVPNGGKPYYIYYENMRIKTSGIGLEYELGSYVLYSYLENRSDGDCLKATDGVTTYTPSNPNMAIFCQYVIHNGEHVSQWNP